MACSFTVIKLLISLMSASIQLDLIIKFLQCLKRLFDHENSAKVAKRTRKKK